MCSSLAQCSITVLRTGSSQRKMTCTGWTSEASPSPLPDLGGTGPASPDSSSVGNLVSNVENKVLTIRNLKRIFAFTCAFGCKFVLH